MARSAGRSGAAALWLPSTRPRWMERAARATSVRGAPIVKLPPPPPPLPLPLPSSLEIRSISSCFVGARLPAARASEMALAAVEQAFAHFLLSSIAAGLVFSLRGGGSGEKKKDGEEDEFFFPCFNSCRPLKKEIFQKKKTRSHPASAAASGSRNRAPPSLPSSYSRALPAAILREE